ncbi:MAG: 4Fe-4S binding protein [Desulfobacterales bacterium]|jgi:ferredoxin|nr:4Fe-4S binding protein [Desulfobacterales bacterium]
MDAFPKTDPDAPVVGGRARYGVILPLLSLVLLSGHFLRFGNSGLCLSVAALAALAATRRAWVRIALMAFLAAGLAVWAGTWADFLAIRLAAGRPWLRMNIIMAAVVALNVLSLVWLVRAGGRVFFNRNPEQAATSGGTFILTAVLAGVVRETVGFPILMLDRFYPGWGWLEILALGVYAAWAAGRMTDPARWSPVRSRIWGLFSLVFFCQLALGIAGVREFLMSGALHLPVPAVIVGGPIYRGGGYFMPILFAATLLIVGPAWCSHLCYIGAWDDALSRSRKRPGALPAWARHGRWFSLAVVVAAALLMRLLGVSTGIAAALGGVFGAAGVVVMLTASGRLGVMAHCTAYCPLGAVSNFLGRVSPWRMRIDSGCSRCSACSQACRYEALKPTDIERGRTGFNCTLCGDCLASCRQASIAYRFPGLSAETARRLFLVLVVSLHAVFLGVARM